MADRPNGEVGFCRASDSVLIAGYMLHPGEEPCISVGKGSGVVFFSLCNMACVYCQNYHFSQRPKGRYVDVPGLGDIFLRLQGMGASNINLVTPEPYLWHISEALFYAREKGLSVPVIYNSSGYVSLPAIELVDSLLDVYLIDLKYIDEGLARRLSKADNYAESAKAFIRFAVGAKGDAVFDDSGRILKGVIIRHLVLPGMIEESKRVLKWLSESFQGGIWLSLMSQFEPAHNAEKYGFYRRVSEEEYEEVVDYALELGLCKGWFQPYGGDNNLLGENLIN